jgi:hypothetical protein
MLFLLHAVRGAVAARSGPIEVTLMHLQQLAAAAAAALVARSSIAIQIFELTAAANKEPASTLLI